MKKFIYSILSMQILVFRQTAVSNHEPQSKMRISYCGIVLLLVLVITSCSKTEPSTVKFEDHLFELPSKVSEIQKNLNLTYGYYSGFSKGNVNSPDISIQMEGYPVFMGSDNDSEESYYDKTVVGVTFDFYDRSIDSVITDLEHNFGGKFSKETINSRKVSLPKLDYFLLKTTDNLLIGIREFDQTAHKQEYFKVSFYKGISDDEFVEYFAPHFE